jgi:hypothetical protein
MAIEATLAVQLVVATKFTFSGLWCELWGLFACSLQTITSRGLRVFLTVTDRAAAEPGMCS